MADKISTKSDPIYALARRAAVAACNKKATDVKILKLQELSSVADYFVICSGDVDYYNIERLWADAPTEIVEAAE